VLHIDHLGEYLEIRNTSSSLGSLITMNVRQPEYVLTRGGPGMYIRLKQQCSSAQRLFTATFVWVNPSYFEYGSSKLYFFHLDIYLLQFRYEFVDELLICVNLPELNIGKYLLFCINIWFRTFSFEYALSSIVSFNNSQIKSACVEIHFLRWFFNPTISLLVLQIIVRIVQTSSVKETCVVYHPRLFVMGSATVWTVQMSAPPCVRVSHIHLSIDALTLDSACTSRSWNTQSFDSEVTQSWIDTL